MEIRQWAEEPFLKSLEQAQKIDIISVIISEYLAKRNINNDEKQFEVIVRTILEWVDRPGNAYAKPCFLRWALSTFHDIRNNNISAFILVEYLKIGYKHEKHREIVFAYEQAKEAERIPEKAISVLNAEAREKAWNNIKAMVISGKTDYDHPDWHNAIMYAWKDLDFKPEKKYIEKFGQIAKNIYLCKVQAMKGQSDSKTEIQELSRIIGKIESGNEVEGVTMMRRKLLIEDFIKTANA